MELSLLTSIGRDIVSFQLLLIHDTYIMKLGREENGCRKMEFAKTNGCIVSYHEETTDVNIFYHLRGLEYTQAISASASICVVNAALSPIKPTG